MAKKKAADAQTWRGSEDLRPLLVPIGDLSLDPANVRKHGERNREAIRASLMRFGQQRPIVIDRRNVVRAGNGTLGEARELGWSHVAVTRSDLDSADLVGYAVADNRTASLAEWDDEALTATLKALADDGFDLDATGFNSAELDELIGSLGADMGGDGEGTGEDPGAQTDRAAELQEKWQTATGQLWTIASKATPGKAHRLLCGDSKKPEDLARLLQGEAVKSVVSDPPYGIDFDTDYRRFTSGFDVPRKNHDKVANDDEPFNPEPWLGYETVVLWGGNCFSNRLPMGTWLVWDKRFANGTAMLADAEIAWMKSGHGAYIFAETSQGFVRPEKILHPTQKPISVMRWSIEKSKAGPILLDPYLGSGTTIVAAEQTGRICYGLELSPPYVAVILERLSGLGLEPTLAA